MGAGKSRKHGACSSHVDKPETTASPFSPLREPALAKDCDGLKATLISLMDGMDETNTINGPCDAMGRTVAHLVCAMGSLSCLEVLLDVGGTHVDWTAMDDKGFTPLHLIAESGRVELLRALYDNLDSLEVNVRASRGDTPLFRAAFCKRKEMYDGLIELGADETIENDDGKRPIDVKTW